MARSRQRTGLAVGCHYVGKASSPMLLELSQNAVEKSEEMQRLVQERAIKTQTENEIVRKAKGGRMQRLKRRLKRKPVDEGGQDSDYEDDMQSVTERSESTRLSGSREVSRPSTRTGNLLGPHTQSHQAVSRQYSRTSSIESYSTARLEARETGRTSQQSLRARSQLSARSLSQQSIRSPSQLDQRALDDLAILNDYQSPQSRAESFCSSQAERRAHSSFSSHRPSSSISNSPYAAHRAQSSTSMRTDYRASPTELERDVNQLTQRELPARLRGNHTKHVNGFRPPGNMSYRHMSVSEDDVSSLKPVEPIVISPGPRKILSAADLRAQSSYSSLRDPYQHPQSQDRYCYTSMDGPRPGSRSHDALRNYSHQGLHPRDALRNYRHVPHPQDFSRDPYRSASAMAYNDAYLMEPRPRSSATQYTAPNRLLQDINQRRFPASSSPVFSHPGNSMRPLSPQAQGFLMNCETTPTGHLMRLRGSRGLRSEQEINPYRVQEGKINPYRVYKEKTTASPPEITGKTMMDNVYGAVGLPFSFHRHGNRF